MSYSDHVIFQEVDRWVNNPDVHNGREAIVTRFARLDPNKREAVLGGGRAWVAADDGSTLRKKSQLLSLNRDLEDVHFALLRAGR